MRYLLATVLLLSGCFYPPVREDVPEKKEPQAASEWPIEAQQHERLRKVKPVPLKPITQSGIDPICEFLTDDKDGVQARLECVERLLNERTGN